MLQTLLVVLVFLGQMLLFSCIMGILGSENPVSVAQNVTAQNLLQQYCRKEVTLATYHWYDENITRGIFQVFSVISPLTNTEQVARSHLSMLPASHPLLRRRDINNMFLLPKEKSLSPKIPAIPAGTRSVDLSDGRKTSGCRQILWSECNFGTRQQQRRKEKTFYIVLADTESSRDVREPFLKFCKVRLCKTM